MISLYLCLKKINHVDFVPKSQIKPHRNCIYLQGFFKIIISEINIECNRKSVKEKFVN